MSTDFSIKPVGAPVATPVAQPVSEAANNAVATVLPASQSVTVRTRAQACATIRSRAERLRIAPGLSRSRRGLDRLSGRSTATTDQVVEQFPDDATLRRRAYFHTLDLTKDAARRGRSPPIARPESRRPS